MRILLVEDEKKIANFIKRGLKAERYVVEEAEDGVKGLFLSKVNTYDLIILDILLPGKDGLSVCKELRENKIDTPILMLSAKSDIKDKICGLDAGADDYLSKPFFFEELVARIRALLRRKRPDKTTILQVGDLELDQVTHKVTRGGQEIILTSREYAFLEYLMLNAGQVVTRTMISEHVWQEDFDTFTNIIDVYVNRLRNKIDKGVERPCIHSLRGTGYVLKE